MMDQKKQIVSLRMNNTDVRKVKQLSRRLGVRESDVFRFAIKSTLAKLAPLQGDRIKGRELVPVFMEFGRELTSYFEFDARRLEMIINTGVDDPGMRVDQDDIELMAMSGNHENYVYLKLRDVAARHEHVNGPATLLRQYLYNKYIEGAEAQPMPVRE